MSWSVAVIVPLVLAMLARAFPYKPVEVYGSANLKELGKKYQKWELFGLLLFFILLPSITYLFGRLFLILSTALSSHQANSVFLILPNSYMWFVPAACFAFAIIIFPMNFIYRLILKERYDEYLHFTNLKHGFDGMRIYRPIAWLFGLLATALVFLMSDYSVEVTDKTIILDDFLTTEKKNYTFDQIKSINYVENTISKDQQTVSPNPHYYLKFNDGNYWNTMSGLTDEAKQHEIMQYLSQKSNQKIDTASYIID